MLGVSFTAQFLKQLKDLNNNLQEEVLQKIEMLGNTNNHKILKAHKLHGKLKGKFSCSVDYKTRIVFCYLNKNEISLLKVGDHDMYR